MFRFKDTSSVVEAKSWLVDSPQRLLEEGKGSYLEDVLSYGNVTSSGDGMAWMAIKHVNYCHKHKYLYSHNLGMCITVLALF